MSPGRAIPNSVAIASPVALWSPVTMTGRMPAARHSATAPLTSSRGGSICPNNPRNRGRPRNNSNPPASSKMASDHSATARIRNACAASPSAAACKRSTSTVPGSHNASKLSGAPFNSTRPRVPCPCCVAIIFAVASKGISVRRGHCRRSRSGSSPPFIATVSNAASVGSPNARHRASVASGGTSRASLHNTTASSNERTSSSPTAVTSRPPSSSRPSGAYPTPVTSNTRPSGNTTATTVISFFVSVPVLSVQITLVDPNVSTAASRRTTAPRRAIRCTPTANAIVIATGNPSGTIETIWLIATIKIVSNGMPRT